MDGKSLRAGYRAMKNPESVACGKRSLALRAPGPCLGHVRRLRGVAVEVRDQSLARGIAMGATELGNRCSVTGTIGVQDPPVLALRFAQVDQYAHRRTRITFGVGAREPEHADQERTTGRFDQTLVESRVQLGELVHVHRRTCGDSIELR